MSTTRDGAARPFADTDPPPIRPIAGRGLPANPHLQRLALWWRRHATRRALGGLDDRMLRDIGITDGDRRRECHKWFWMA